METEDMKTVLLCLDVIGKSREVLVETLEKVDSDGMPDGGRSDLFGISEFCKTLKKEINFVDRYVGDMKELISAGDEQEIEDSVLLIENILLDNIPPKPHLHTDMVHEAHNAAGIERLRWCVVNQ